MSCFVPDCERKVRFRIEQRPHTIERYSCRKHLGEGCSDLISYWGQMCAVTKYG